MWVTTTGKVVRNTKGRGRTVYLQITNVELAKLLKVHVNTVRRWIREKRFDPTSLESIIEYHQPNT